MEEKSQNKSLVIIISSLIRGGSQNQMLMMMNTFKYKFNNIYIISLNSINNYTNVLEKHNVKVSLYPLSKNITGIFNIFKAIKYIIKLNPTAIYTSTIYANIIGVISCKIFSSAFLISSIRTKYNKITLLNIIEKYFLRLSDIITINYPGNNSYFNKNYLKPIYLKNIVKYPTVKNKHKQNIWLSVCRLIDDKNVKNMILCFERFLKVYPKHKLIIVGEGELYDETKILIDKLCLTEKIELVGYLENPKYYYTISKYYISTSIREGTPNAVLEAISYSLPCVLTPLIYTKKLILDDLFGFVSKDFSNRSIVNAMIKLVESDDYDRIAENALINLKKVHNNDLSLKTLQMTLNAI